MALSTWCILYRNLIKEEIYIDFFLVVVAFLGCDYRALRLHRIVFATDPKTSVSLLYPVWSERHLTTGDQYQNHAQAPASGTTMLLLTRFPRLISKGERVNHWRRENFYAERYKNPKDLGRNPFNETKRKNQYKYKWIKIGSVLRLHICVTKCAWNMEGISAAG